MGTLGLWGWAGGAWQWGHPGGITGDTWDGLTPGKGCWSGMHSYGNPGVVGLGRGCLVLGAAWGHHRGHMGWGDTREGMMEWGATRKECIPMGILGLDRGCLVLGTSVGTRGMGGQ